MKKLFASVPVLAAVLLACTSSKSSGGTSGSSCGEYAACSLITASAVGAAFGTTFSAGTEKDTNKTPSATDAELVSCNFAGTNGWNVIVNVRCAPAGDNDEQSDEYAAQLLGDTATSVSGVGDEAFWAAPGPDGGALPNAYTLNVLSGADLYVFVNVLTPSGTASPQAGATTVAQTVLGAL